MEFWQSHFLFFIFTIGVISLMIGSFLNVVIYRLPLMLYQAQHDLTNTLDSKIKITIPSTFNLALPASHCPKCQHQLRWWENIPLLSYFLLKGHCAYCKQSISIHYPLVEFFSLLLSIYLAWHYGIHIQLIAALIFAWFLLSLALIDINEKILPDIMTLSLLWLGLLFNLNGLFTDLTSAVIGAVSGYLFLWLIAFAYYSITGKEGLGLGDCKLLAALGAWLGWQILPFVVLIASLSGCLFGIIFICLRKLNRQSLIPFGPFLAIAGLCGLIWGQNILNHFIFISSL